MLLFRGFSHRAFTFLWFAQAISRVGDGIHTVALAWLVGFVVAGVASDAIGPSAVFIAGGLFSAAILALVWSLPARRLD